jgi:hypothetical protein
MMQKDVGENWEKEAIRRYLLASTLTAPERGGKGTPSRLAGYWQRWLKKAWLQ